MSSCSTRVTQDLFSGLWLLLLFFLSGFSVIPSFTNHGHISDQSRKGTSLKQSQNSLLLLFLFRSLIEQQKMCSLQLAAKSPVKTCNIRVIILMESEKPIRSLRFVLLNFGFLHYGSRGLHAGKVCHMHQCVGYAIDHV